MLDIVRALAWQKQREGRTDYVRLGEASTALSSLGFETTTVSDSAATFVLA